MRRILGVLGIGWMAVCLLIFHPQILMAEPTLSGANYWGDSGNASIDGPDVSQLKDLLGGMAVSYPTIEPNNRARSEYWQDVSGNGSIDGPDLSILKSWLAGDYGDLSGNPTVLENETVTATVVAGDSVTLGARGASGFNWYRTGWGLNFKIVSSTCIGAQLYGRNPAGSKTYILGSEVYEYTSDPPPTDDGYARVKVFAPGSCTAGQEIEIEVSVPSDSYSGAPNNRHPNKLTAAENVTIMVNQSVTAIALAPAGASIQEGDFIPFSAICTLLDASTIDCTDSYGGVSTLWSSTGDLNRLSPPNFFQAKLDGAHGTVTVSYNDGVHAPVSDFASIIIQADHNPPQTFIYAYPPNPDKSSSPSFYFYCDDFPCTFQCQLDSGGFSACFSPKNYSGLSEASHTFQVKATDFAGNTDSTPASWTWTIDLTPPDTQITNQPPALTNATGALFEFTCTGGPCAFECKKDSESFSSCTTPQTYSSLAEGAHTFTVRALDLALNPDPSPAAYAWTIDITPPETFLDTYPPNPSSSTTADFSFHCTGGPCVFDCNLDSTGWSSCVSPKTYTGLSEASHSFQVRATDLAGNADLTPALYAWNIAFHDYWIKNTIIRSLPGARMNHTAVWTGTEMIVWAGGLSSSSYLKTGGRYNPVTDSWASTSTTNAPAGTQNHTAVWTGTEMIVWGGYRASYTNAGGRYNPATDSWTATSYTNAPSGSAYHTAVWTGTEMMVWGGQTSNSAPYFTNMGGKYNPITNSWTATSAGANAPSARYWHTAVWTNAEMIVWGGYDTSYVNTGGRYNPLLDSWTATSTGANVPSARYYHTAVWTGTEMIVWGGNPTTNTGGRYNPVSDSWTPTSTGANVPSARYYHTAVWTGIEMIVWAGYGASNDGGKYNPSTNAWTPTSTANAPQYRQNHTAVWTSGLPTPVMIVWGGWDGFSYPYNTGGNYNPATNSWTATCPTNAPAGRSYHTAVWTGAEMIVWGGFIGSTAYFNTGGRYNPTTDSWTATSTGANVPAARKDHTAVWTGAEMVVWGGDNASYLNTGGRYNPVTNSWTVTSTAANVPSARCFHTAVWTGNEMIIWAGTSGSGVYVNTGARYNPITDSWTPTSTGANVPLGRVNHTAVWTSGLTTPLMIVWGGWYYSGSNIYTNTGGIYNPSSNSWTATSTNAPVPSARIYHTAVWTTGLTTPVMIIWGGYFYDTSAHYYNNGANYNPGTNSWTATSASPAARDYHTAVWSGTQMIVWGGYTSGSTNTNTGGRYNPSLNSWNSTSLINVPDARACHTAVWTGNEMIIWGGSPTNVNSGGRYVP